MNDILFRNNVRISGNGTQTIIFAHGFGCDQNVWRHILPKFTADYKIVVFDYVGAGQSDLSAYSSQRYNSIDGYAQDILDICETLDIVDAIFVGHSVSSIIGLKAAILKPQYFSKLIFLAPSPSYVNNGNYIGGFEKSDLVDLFEIMENNYLGWSSTYAPLIMGNMERPELGQELTANFCATDPNIAKEFARVTFFTDSRDDLRASPIPSLTVQCSNDILAPVTVGNFIHEHTPGNSLVVLQATGHCPHLSAPDETVNAIKTFLTADILNKEL